MPFDATRPDKVPVKNTTIVDIKSMNAASLGDCSSGCDTNSRPQIMPSTIMLNTIANNTPTVTTMRACNSFGVYLYRVTVLRHIDQAHCKLCCVCALFLVVCCRVLFHKTSMSVMQSFALFFYGAISTYCCGTINVPALE